MAEGTNGPTGSSMGQIGPNFPSMGPVGPTIVMRAYVDQIQMVPCAQPVTAWGRTFPATNRPEQYRTVIRMGIAEPSDAGRSLTFDDTELTTPIAINDIYELFLNVRVPSWNLRQQASTLPYADLYNQVQRWGAGDSGPAIVRNGIVRQIVMVPRPQEIPAALTSTGLPFPPAGTGRVRQYASGIENTRMLVEVYAADPSGSPLVMLSLLDHQVPKPIEPGQRVEVIFRLRRRQTSPAYLDDSAVPEYDTRWGADFDWP